MTDYGRRFRERLQAALDRGEITKKDLHRVTGRSRSLIDSWLDDSVPGLDSAGQVAEALGLTLSEFLDDSEPSARITDLHPSPEDCYHRLGLALGVAAAEEIECARRLASAQTEEELAAVVAEYQKKFPVDPPSKKKRKG